MRLHAIDRESAEEKLAAKASPPAEGRRRTAEPAPGVAGTIGEVLSSPIAKSVARTVAVAVAGTLVRGVMGALLGSPRRRRYEKSL